MIPLAVRFKKQTIVVLFFMLTVMTACAAPAPPSAGVPVSAPVTAQTELAAAGSYTIQPTDFVIASAVKLDLPVGQTTWFSTTLPGDDDKLGWSAFGPISAVPPAWDETTWPPDLVTVLLPSDEGPSKDAIGLVWPMLISGYSPIVCLEENGKSYLFIDKPAITQKYESLLRLPEYEGLASLVATCGEVVGGGGEVEACEKCGCVGPMSGPRCGFNASQVGASVQFIKLSSPGE